VNDYVKNKLGDGNNSNISLTKIFIKMQHIQIQEFMEAI